MTGHEVIGQDAAGDHSRPVPRQQSGVPSESELQQMRDKQILEVIRETVVELRSMGDRLERLANIHSQPSGERV